MKTTEGSVKVGDVEIAYWSSGEGTPVVILGGPWFGHYYLRPLVESVAQEFQVIAYDPRGAGRSSPLAADKITLAGHLEDLEDLRRRLNIERLNLVGHSFGAHIALLYAAQHPETTASLVIADAGPPFDPEMQEMLHKAFVEGHTPEDKKMMREIQSSPGFMTRDAKTHGEYFKTLYSPFFKDRAYLARLEFGFTPTTAQHALEAEERLVYQLLEQDPVGSLSQITCPTLVIHAERDLIPEAFSRSLADRIRGAEYTNLKGVGHFAYLEDPTLFKNTVVAFLERNAR